MSEADVHHVVSDQVKYTRPSADVPVVRVRRRTPALRDMHGEFIAASRPTARLTETCSRHPTPEAAVT